MAELATEHGEETTVMIDATYLKSHRTASSLGAKKRVRGRVIGRTNGGMNSKLHAVCESQGRLISFFVSAGQVSDFIEARALLNCLPKVEWLLEDRSYDAYWFRKALRDKWKRACISGRKQRKTIAKHDRRLNRIEIIFSRLEGWRYVATRLTGASSPSSNF